MYFGENCPYWLSFSIVARNVHTGYLSLLWREFSVLAIICIAWAVFCNSFTNECCTVKSAFVALVNVPIALLKTSAAFFRSVLAKQWAKHCQSFFAHYSATWIPQWKKKTNSHALLRLSQFGKVTLNESTSRDSHLTVLHAFRPVNKQQKQHLLTLRWVNTTCTPAAAWPDSLFSMAARVWSTFSFLLCCMHGQQMLPLRIMIKKEVINTRCNHFLRPQNVKLT